MKNWTLTLLFSAMMILSAAGMSFAVDPGAIEINNLSITQRGYVFDTPATTESTGEFNETGGVRY